MTPIYAVLGLFSIQKRFIFFYSSYTLLILQFAHFQLNLTGLQLGLFREICLDLKGLVEDNSINRELEYHCNGVHHFLTIFFVASPITFNSWKVHFLQKLLKLLRPSPVSGNLKQSVPLSIIFGTVRLFRNFLMSPFEIFDILQQNEC